MKNFLLIFFFGFLFSMGILRGKQADSLSYLYEKEEIIPLQLNQEQLKKFQNDKNYDYYFHIVKDERSLLDMLRAAILRWFIEKMNINVTRKQVDYGLLTIGVILVAGFIFLLFRYRPSFFFMNKKIKLQQTEEEETIYGIDFEKLIKQALDVGDYVSAIRWKYLQTLKWMEEKGQITWNPNKTVNEYVYEMKDSDLKYLFKDISYLFLHFRYGNFEATEQHFSESKTISGKIRTKLNV